jgi:hypothetical protein
MKTYKHILAIISMAFIATLSSASAHISYSGRDFGSFSASGSDAPVLLSSKTVLGNYGWASATDANLGDSHKLRAFKFKLLNTGLVTLEIQGLDSIISNVPVSALAHPGFSIFKGLAESASHDFSAASRAYNDRTYGPNGNWPTTTKNGNIYPNPGAPNWEGSVKALDNWAVGVDGAAVDSQLSYFTYVGNAADGTSSIFGTATGINGDGNADGTLSRSFVLSAGEYSIFVGGAQYFGTSNDGADTTTSFAFNATLSVAVIPEPSTYALFGLGALLITFAYRRRVASGTQGTL